jgi:ribose/xylose/arabinose/galactoside ABC-type transport system permease subunit
MATTQTMNLGEAPTSASARTRAALGRRTEWRGVLLLVLLVIGALIYAPTVFAAYEVTLGFVALIGLIALGLTAVILMGELDLSVASTLAVAGVIMAMVPNIFLGIVLALGAGLLIGAVNAFFVVKVGINSFIATLGMLFALRGLAFVLSDEMPVALTNADAGISFGRPLLGPITPRIILFVLVFIALHVFLTRVRAGREFYAVGGNRQAARDAGIPVSRRIFTGFMISGSVAALAGVINTLELTAADPTAGETALLTSFAAAIIGGTVLTGGRGSVLGTLIGAGALGILIVGLTLYGIQAEIQFIFIGAVLFIAVITDPASLRAVAGSLRTSLQGRRPQTDG